MSTRRSILLALAGLTVPAAAEAATPPKKKIPARKRLLERHRGSDWAALLGALDPALASPWEELRADLQQVAELNRVNERIVARTRHSTERLLSMLRGQFDPVGVYDRSGQRRACGDNRPITSA